jgi:hypothetical protein
MSGVRASTGSPTTSGTRRTDTSFDDVLAEADAIIEQHDSATG